MPDRPILFASYSGLLGGAERVLLDCATRIPRPLIVACPEGPLAAAVRAAGLRHARVAERSLRLGPGHAAGLLGFARELQRLETPAALVAWGARATLAAALLRRPTVAVHHDLYGSPALRTALRATTRRADAAVAASFAIAREIAGEPRRGRAGAGAHVLHGRFDVIVLHPGVDLGAFTPTPLSDGPPRVLVLGALVGWKRPELAVDIAARVPEVQLTFAGAPLPGEDDAALRARAATLDGRVTFAGHVGDVRSALEQSHCLLHCADAEPFGLALVEALAAGRPVVAPAAAGPLEIVVNGAGRLYAPGDAEAGAEALRAVLADADAPRAARRRAEAFDVRDSAARLEAAIASVLT